MRITPVSRSHGRPYLAGMSEIKNRQLGASGLAVSAPVKHVTLNNGLGVTARQLRQLAEVLAERGEADAARRAIDALTQTLAAMPGND